MDVDKIRLDHLPCVLSVVRYLRPFVAASVIMSPASRFLRIISHQSAASFDQNQALSDFIKRLPSYLLLGVCVTAHRFTKTT